MNFRKLITYLTMGTAAAMPLAVAQNPTILQGSYISNVFGNSNFVLNPNAQTNIANVTVSSATVTRSTTTPLVATSEFNITTSTSTGYADWSTRTFDAGMKNQNCEARFTYRGFSVGSTTAQIIQGASTVVAQLTLTASTDPRIASINFPCGDLSAATKFRLQQATASLTGTNEIGAIYVGLATNMANVAQAEMVGMVTFNNGSAGKAGTTAVWTEYDAGTWTPTVIGQGTGSNRLQIAFSYLPAGRYYVNAVINPVVYGGTTTSHACRFGILETTSNYVTSIADNQPTAANTYKTIPTPLNGTFDFTSGAARTFKIVVNGSGFTQSATGNCFSEQTSVDTKVQLAVYRFPSSSELVVKPETQNVWAAVVYNGVSQSIRAGQAASGTFYPFDTGWNVASARQGKAEATTTNSGNDLGFSISNLPVGAYKLHVTGLLQPEVPIAGGTVECNYRIAETDSSGTLRTEIANQLTRDIYITSATTRNWINSFQGIYQNTSVGTRNFRIEAAKRGDSTAGVAGYCQAYSSATSGTNLSSKLVLTLEPLDQPSNSALYVQGPILGAQTGAAIPEGYVNEWSTREISDTSMRSQATPNNNQWYYPWTGKLTLPAGNWLLCYAVLAQVDTSSSTANYPAIQTRIENETDGTELVSNMTIAQQNASFTTMAHAHSSCYPTAITASKVFRIGIRYTNWSGAPSVSNIFIRGDQNKSRLQAIRLN